CPFARSISFDNKWHIQSDLVPGNTAIFYERVWHCRNLCFYEGKMMDLKMWLSSVKATVIEHVHAQACRLMDPKAHPTPLCFYWTNSGMSCTYIFIDATFRDGKTCTGVMGKDTANSILLIATKFFNA
ncbi:hypothetical protein TorRG33x02_248410, partial [Trema orientale]